MIQPIIIPITNTRKVNCIIQDGVRYCENNPMTKQQGGFIALGIAGVIFWFMFWFWVSIKIEERWDIFFAVPILLGGFVLPAIIIGLLLLF